MTYKETTLNISYIPLKEAYAIRRQFVNKFVDKTTELYRYSMGHGDFYGTNSHRHCLWESFHRYNILSKASALKFVSKMPEIYVTWDRSPTSLSSNLQKTRLIKISGQELVNGINNKFNFDFSPSDVYVFDTDISFHITFTHQHISGFGDVCLTSVDDIEDNGISLAFQQFFKTFGLAQFHE